MTGSAVRALRRFSRVVHPPDTEVNVSIDPRSLRRPAIASTVVGAVLVLSIVLLDRPAYAGPGRPAPVLSIVDRSSDAQLFHYGLSPEPL